jgi:hypothetical protein
MAGEFVLVKELSCFFFGEDAGIAFLRPSVAER